MNNNFELYRKGSGNSWYLQGRCGNKNKNLSNRVSAMHIEEYLSTRFF